MAASGAFIGLGLAYAGRRLASNRLFEVPEFDPPMLALAVTSVLGVTLVAFLVPAFRAAPRSPSDGLRAD